MPDYKVRNKKQGAGRYEFSYGRGKKKLTAGAWNNEVAGGWQVDAHEASAAVVNEDAPYKKLKDLKAAWGEWAREAYESGEEAEQSESETGSPPLSTRPTHPGPPPFKRKGPPKHKPSLKQQGPPQRKTRPGNRPWPVDGVTDPFDPRFRYPSDHENPALRKRHTPLAVVIEVWNALDNTPIQGQPALVSMYHEIERVVARECPELLKENGRVQSPTEAAEVAEPHRGLSRDTLNSAIRGGDADQFGEDIPF